MKLRLFYGLLIACLMSACVKPKPPVFKDIERLEVAYGDSVELSGDALLFNPNTRGLTLKEVRLDVLVGEDKWGGLDKKYDLKIQGNSDFKVPFVIKIPSEKVKQNLLGTLLSFFGGKPTELKFKGYVKVGTHGFSFRVPVSVTREFDFK